MNKRKTLQIGDHMFLMNKEVIVLCVYDLFQIVKLRYVEEIYEFFVDVYALTAQPNCTNTISIRILGRDLC